MKFRKISTVLAFGALIALAGCSKDDGAVPNRVTVTEVPAITTNIDVTGSQAINLLNLASFSGKFKVDNYFPGAKTPTKVDIVVRKFNGATVSNANVRVFKADVTTLPATYTVTAAELAALFGVPIALGDNYDFAPDIYVGDRKFEAFPAVGLGTGAGVIGMPLYGEFARFSAICAYDPAIYVGNFVVVSDAWVNGLAAGTVVTLTTVSPNSFRMTYPNGFVTPAVPTPSFVVVVNTANNNTTVAAQVIGTKLAQYNNPTVTSTTGSVTPCDREVSMNITYTVAEGSFGTQNIRLRKQ